MAVEAVVFDVGETLVDETNMWTRVAAAGGVTPFTLMAGHMSVPAFTRFFRKCTGKYSNCKGSVHTPPGRFAASRSTSLRQSSMAT